MSSKEIAELTGKRHGDVIRDIRGMLVALQDDAKMRHELNQGVREVKDDRGYTDRYTMRKRETLILVSGYSVPLRARIIDRWQELESQTALPAQPVIDLENPASLRGLLLGW